MDGLRPDYTKINLLKKIQGEMAKQRTYLKDLKQGYKNAMHDLELLKETNYLTGEEYDKEIGKLKDSFIQYALECED